MKVRFYQKDITPPLGCNIPGYANIRLASTVKTRIYEKAAVIEVDGEYVAFLVTDQLFIPCGLSGQRLVTPQNEIGEVFSKFVYDIRKASPTDKNICCAYSQSDVVTCYMPTRNMHLLLAYELSIYSARFAPGTGEAETEAVIRMGKKCFE